MKLSFLNITIILLYLYLIIDTLNGLLIRNYDFSISPIYKAFILILISTILLKNKIFVPFFYILIFVCFTLLHLLMDTFSEIEFFWILRFMTIVFTFYFFKFLIINNKFSVIKRIFFINFSILSLNILLGATGYGYAQYGRDDVGTRGLFYAGNEVGVLLIVTTMFVLSSFLINKDIKNYLIVSLISLALAILLTSKVALLGSSVVIFVLPIINLIATKRGFIFKRTSFIMVGIATAIFIVLVPYAIYFTLYEMNLIARISYWMNKVDYVTLFYSGRNLLANDIFTFLQNDTSYFNMLFGYGYEKIIFIAGRSVELDGIDLFMLYGLIGIVIIYGFFIKIFIDNVKKDSNIYTYKPYVQFGIFFILLLSISSGHVINSGLASIMIGAFLSLSSYREDSKKCL